MTRPGSPAAWASTAWMTGPSAASAAPRDAGPGVSARAARRPARGRRRAGRRDRRCRGGGRGAACRGRGRARSWPGRLPADVEPQRDDRLALRLRPAEQLVDLASGGGAACASASARGCSGCRLLERRDVGADQPGLAALDAGVGVGQVGLAGPDRLDLRPGQDDAGLERLLDREFVAGSSVEGDGLSSSRHAVAPRSSALARPDARTPAQCGPAFELLTHPQGVRLDGHLLRGGAATRTVDHCTSPPFVPGNRTRCAKASASSGTGRRAQAAARRRRRGGVAAPSSSSALSRIGSVAGRESVGQRRRRRPGSMPASWIQRLSGVSHRAIVSRNAPPSPGSSCHCWTVPLPNDVCADERRPPAVLERAGDDLAGRRAAAVDQARRPRSSGRWPAPPGRRVGRDLVARRRPPPRRSAPEPMNWLAIVRAAVT